MFSTNSQLRKRTPDNGTDRKNFLTLLVDEYLNAASHEAKFQVLANLANFSYDPINYAFIRDVGVLDIFIHVLKNESDEKLMHYACAGICNLSPDPVNIEYIITQGGLEPLKLLLKSKDGNIVADVLTTLIYVLNDSTKFDIKSSDVIQNIEKLEQSQDKRLSNLATIFKQDILNKIA